MTFIGKMAELVTGKRKKGNKLCHKCGKDANNNLEYYPFYDNEVPICNICVKLEQFSINRTSSSEPLLSDSLISLDLVDNNNVSSVPDSLIKLLLTDDDKLTNNVPYQKPRILCAWCYTADTEYFIKYGRCACGAKGMYTAIGIFKN